jgi:hypothetical protein
MSISENLIEVREYKGNGYKPLVDYDTWRVAILRYDTELLPERINKVQRHEETDEVFVLLQGKCILFICDGSNEAGEVYGVNMEPLKLYNVKKSAWHSHTLSKDAVVLIVENKETTAENSPCCSLDSEQQCKIVNLTQKFWNE